MMRSPRLRVILELVLLLGLTFPLSSRSQDPPASADAPTDAAVLQRLEQIGSRGTELLDPAELQAFLRLAAQAAGGRGGAMTYLSGLKKTPGYSAAMENAENLIMATIRQTLIRTVAECNRPHLSLLRVFAVGFSGKWPAKPRSLMGFEGDFDVTFFSVLFEQTDPENLTGFAEKVRTELASRLGIDPKSAGIVLTGMGHEKKAGVYVTSAGVKWAVDNMPHLYILDASGEFVDVANTRDVFYRRLLREMALKYLPESAQKGRPLEEMTVEEVRKALLESDAVPARFKGLIAGGTKVKMSDAVAAGFDFLSHLGEIHEAGTPGKKISKVAKQLARYNSIFVNAMQTARADNWRQRGGFTAYEENLMLICSRLEGAEIAMSDAFAQLARGGVSAAEAIRIINGAGQAEAHFEALMKEVLGKKPPEKFLAEVAAVMLKMIRLSYNVGAYWTMASESCLPELKDLIENLKAAIEALKKNKVEARDAEAILENVTRIASEIAGAQGKGIFFTKTFGELWKELNAPRGDRKQVKTYLESTETGKSLLKHIPEWFWTGEYPGMKNPEIDNPRVMVEALLKPVSDAREVARAAVTPLMFLDMALNIHELWYNQPDLDYTRKFIESGKLAAMVIIPHAWVVPVMCQASLSGSGTRFFGQGVIVVTCLLCPEAMLPDLLKTLYGHVGTYANRGLFQKELEYMFLASRFDPEPNRETWDWKDSRQVRYTWLSMEGANGETYTRDSLARYIRGLAEKDPEVMPLSCQHQQGSCEFVSGMRLLVGQGVHLAFKRMLENGDHRLFRENGELAAAMGALRQFTYSWMWQFMDLPDDAGVGSLAKKDYRIDLIDNTIPEEEASRMLEAEGSGYVRFVRQLLAQRAKLQQEVIRTLTQSIVTSFEDEMRARRLVDEGKLEEIRKEVACLGKELGIEEELVSAVHGDVRQRVTGFTGNALNWAGWDWTTREKRESAKVINKWLDAYRTVVQVRRSLLLSLDFADVPAAESKILLYGRPPFAVRADFDTARADNARTYLAEITPFDARRVLTQLKGERVDEESSVDFDGLRAITRLLVLARLQELKINEPFELAPHWTGNANRYADRPDAFVTLATDAFKRKVDEFLAPRYLTEILGLAAQPDLSSVTAAYARIAKDYAAKLKEIRDQYRGIEAMLKINGKDKTAPKLPVPLSVTLIPTKPALTAVVEQVKYDWTVEGIPDGSGKTYVFTSMVAGDFTIGVNAWRQGSTSRIEVAKASHTIKVEKKEADATNAPPSDVKKPGDTNAPPAKPRFSGVAPGIWTVVCNDDTHGLDMRRQPARMKTEGKGESGVDAVLHVNYPSQTKRDPAQIPALLEATLKEHVVGRVPPNPAAGLTKIWDGGVAGFSLAGFAGHLLNYPMWRCRGRVDGLTMSPLTSYHGVSGDGYVFKDGLEMGCMYNVTGGGLWDNSDIGFLYSQTRAAQNEAKAILAGLTIDTKGLIRAVPHKGPKLDGSDAPAVRLVPSYNGTLRVHDIVTIKAVVDNAQPEDSPLKFEWDGDHAGSGPEVQIVATKPGRLRIGVNVTGAQYALGSAYLEFKVEDFRAVVRRDPPSDEPVVAGQEVGFVCELLADGQPAGDGYMVQWQPHPEVTFVPYYAKGRATKARFPRPGRCAVWVEAMRRQGDVDITHAVSDPVAINVVEPDLAISLDPAQPYVGQEVKAKATARPRSVGEKPRDGTKLEGIEFLWDASPAVKLLNENADRSEVLLRINDPLPAWIRVTAQTVYHGDNLGSLQSNITARPYPLKVAVVGATFGMKPQVWDPVRKGLVTLDRSVYAGDEMVTCRAEFDGPDKPDGINWKWSINEGTTMHSSGLGSEVSVSRHETGTAHVRVEARDKESVLMGIASNHFEVTVPVEQVQSPPEYSVSICCAKSTIAVGEKTVVEALAVGGKKPYSYSWSGPVESVGSACRFRGVKVGNYEVAVSVSDARNRRITTNLMVTVVEPKGKPGDKSGTTGAGAKPGGGTKPQDEVSPAPPKGAEAGPSHGQGAGTTRRTGPSSDPSSSGAASTQTTAATAAGATLQVLTPRAAPGRPVKVRILNPPGEKHAWIGFFKVNARDRDYLKYSYLNALDNNTYEDVLAPDEAGLYNFRLFRDETYVPVAVSDPIQVR